MYCLKIQQTKAYLFFYRVSRRFMRISAKQISQYNLPHLRYTTCGIFPCFSHCFQQSASLQIINLWHISLFQSLHINSLPIQLAPPQIYNLWHIFLFGHCLSSLPIRLASPEQPVAYFLVSEAQPGFTSGRTQTRPSLPVMKISAGPSSWGNISDSPRITTRAPLIRRVL